MTKKKKKGAAAGVGEPKLADAVCAADNGNTILPTTAALGLRMKLLSTVYTGRSSNSSSKRHGNSAPIIDPSYVSGPPRVVVTESDAQRLHLGPRDSVLIVVERNSDAADEEKGGTDNDNDDGEPLRLVTFAAAAIVEALIVSANNNDKQISSPQSYTNRTTPTKSSLLRPVVVDGSIQATSKSLFDNLTGSQRQGKEEGALEDDRTNVFHENTDSAAKRLLLHSQQPTPDSTPPSPFSFRGMVATSPRSPAVPSSATPRGRTHSAPTTKDSGFCVWLIPCQSPFGQKCRTAICRPCHTLTMEVVVENGSFDARTPKHRAMHPLEHTAKNNNTAIRVEHARNRLVERLILAYTVGQCFGANYTVTISVQGQPCRVRVLDATPTPTPTIRQSNANDDAASTTLLQAASASMTKEVSMQPTAELSSVAELQEKLSGLVVDSNPTITSKDNDIRQHEIPNSQTVQTAWVAALAAAFPLRLYEISYATNIHLETLSTVQSLPPSPNIPAQPKKYVAGLDSTYAHVRALLETPFRHWELFHSAQMAAPRGVLLYGPSGVGKTCLARQLADEFATVSFADSNGAVPNNDSFGKRNGSVFVQYIHCSTLQSQSAVVGQAERALTEIFGMPATMQHKLLIFDDVHLICAKRGSGAAGGDRLAATLLALVDGIRAGRTQSDGTLAILAITSNPSLLDPALRRPGRLDTEVEVPIPDDAPTRAEILRFQLDSLGVSLSQNEDDNFDISEGDWLELAKLAKGFNGADCMLAVKEAVRCAILEQLPSSNNKGNYDDEQANDSGRPSRGAELKVRVHHLRAAIRTVKPSSIKSITIEIPQVFWSSIGGMDSVKRDLREAIELPLTHGAYFTQLRIPPPRGILLYGPPGCSKTLMARALATESNMNFLAVKGPELLSKWLGESERALASLFRRARMASPSIIFFDEMDAIASRRGSGGDSASSGRLLSQLLTELDGVNSAMPWNASSNKAPSVCRVIVVGATNRPDLLDPALTRPGRIDRMIYVGVPDESSRAQIWRLILRRGDDKDNPMMNDEEMVHVLARESAGFSGAELVAIGRDAALLALEEEAESENDGNATTTTNNTSGPHQIAMRHLQAAMSNMPRQITPEMLRFYESYRMERESKT